MLNLQRPHDAVISDLHSINRKLITALESAHPENHAEFERLMVQYERVILYVHGLNLESQSLLQEAGLAEGDLELLPVTEIGHPAIESELYVLRRNLRRLEEKLEEVRTSSAVRRDFLSRNKALSEATIEAFLEEREETLWISCSPPEDAEAFAVLLPLESLLEEHKALARGGPLLAEVLRAYRGFNGYQPETVPVDLLEDGEQLNAAFLLWEPFEQGPYASFREAADAARRLL